MPSDDRDQTSPQAERLSRKIERLQSGQPAPVLDGDTEDLAEIARILMERLDPATPDPDFRAQLKRDLLDPGPRLVQLPRKPKPRRYPVPALFGALTVVLVASAVTGWMAFAEYRDLNDDRADSLARFASASPTAMEASGSLVTAIAPTPAASAADGNALAGDPPGDAVPFEANPTPTASSSEIEADDVALAAPSEAQSAVVDLPPVDARHVELGALATVSAAAGTTEAPEVRYTAALDPSAIELDAQAPAYEFSAPYIEADLMLRGVSNFLGIEPEIDRRDRGGRTIYALTDPEGSVNFTWSPESGAFACTLPDPYSVAEIEDLSRAAIEWLRAFGYPIDEANANPVIRTTDDGKTFIDVPLGGGDMPNPAIGHPMSITLVVDRDGRIVSASGYWLEVTREARVALLSARQAWDIVRAGDGYWPTGTGPSSPGEFVAHGFAVSYMLTSDGDNNHALTLQPVIAITGLFAPDDGATPFETTVYVKAHLSQS